MSQPRASRAFCFSLALLLATTALLILLLLLLAPSSLAEEGPGARGATRNGLSVEIGEDYTLRFPEGFTTINITGSYEFDKVFYEDEVRNASDVQAAYQNGSANEQKGIVEFFEGMVGGYLNNVLNNTFEDSEDQDVSFEVDVTTLEDANYTGPIRVLGYGEAELTTEDFGFETDVMDPGEVIQGVFTMGAEVELGVRLSAPEGNRRVLRISPPETTGFRTKSDGFVTLDLVELEIDNTTGAAAPQVGTLYLASKDPNPAIEERIDVNIVVDWKEFDSTEVKVILEAYSLDVTKYSELSDHIRGLDFIPADGVRMALDNTLGTWDIEEIKKQAADNATKEVEEILSDSLDSAVPLSIGFYWNESSFDAGYDENVMSSSPPLQAEMSSGPVIPNLYPLEDVFEIDDLEVVRGFLNAGARAEFDIDGMEFSPEYNPEITLLLPENMRLANTDADEEPEGMRYSYSWDPEDGLSGEIISTTAPEYEESKVELDAVLDFKKFNVDIFAIEDSSLSTDFSGELQFFQFELTDVIADLLPVEVDIDYINADVLRLVYNKDLVDFKELEDMLREKTEEYESEFSDSLGEEIYISINIDESTLDDYNVEEMDNKPPIRVTGGTHVDIPIARDSDEMAVGSSFYLKTVDFDFELPAMKGWKIALQLILPKGVEIVELNDDNRNAVQGTVGGRDSFSVEINEKSNHIYMTLGVTPTLILETCQTYILVIVGIVILFMIRRRMKRAKRMREEEEEEMEAAQNALKEEQILSLQKPGPGAPPQQGGGFESFRQMPDSPPTTGTVPSLTWRRDQDGK